MATIQTYNKGTCLPLDGDDLQAITTLAVTCLKEHKGIPAKYPNTPQGLADFMQRSQEFFAYCNDINADLEPDQRIIPDVEAWCLYMGIVRSTLHEYGKRSETWKNAIDMVKTAIMSAKKQLAMRGKIPQMIAVFDWTNNHQYLNTSEFKITAETPQDTVTPQISEAELQRFAADYTTEPSQLPQMPE